MTEPDCITYMNHVVDVHKLVFVVEGRGGWILNILLKSVKTMSRQVKKTHDRVRQVRQLVYVVIHGKSTYPGLETQMMHLEPRRHHCGHWWWL